MPKSFATTPGVGELVDTGPFGKLVVVRVELDDLGDPHLYLESRVEQTAAPTA